MSDPEIIQPVRTVEVQALAPLPRAEPEQSITLFGSDQPGLVIKRATEVARLLADIINDRKLFVRIQNKDYVLFEGWSCLGSILGVFPYVVETKEIVREGKVVGFEAFAEARTKGGQVIGRGAARCTKEEGRWGKADEYAVFSMAQTRAMGKSLRLPLGWVMTLAGYQGTPWEEMESVVDKQRGPTVRDFDPDDDLPDAGTAPHPKDELLRLCESGSAEIVEAAKALGIKGPTLALAKVDPRKFIQGLKVEQAAKVLEAALAARS